MNTDPSKNQGYQLMGAAFEVYNEIGYGLGEDLYQESLEIELALRAIPFQHTRPFCLRQYRR